MDMRCPLILIFATICTCNLAQALDDQPINNSPPEFPMGCQRKFLTYEVTQADSNGHKCWDIVTVAICMGRCDSMEISDWKFPYKRSVHPVCLHGTRLTKVAELRHCHPKAGDSARRYEFVEAGSCHCRKCSSTDTSCEWSGFSVFNILGGKTVLSISGTDSEGLDD